MDMVISQLKDFNYTERKEENKKEKRSKAHRLLACIRASILDNHHTVLNSLLRLNTLYKTKARLYKVRIRQPLGNYTIST